MTTIRSITADCLDAMSFMETGSVDMVFTSPPYEDARTYGIGFKLKGQAWVDWALPRFIECCRCSRGLVAWVVEGKTRNFQWSATPALLMAGLHRAGVKLRKPPAFHRIGIPGSGGPDWLRNDYEFIVCASHGKLPWSDNVAMGKRINAGLSSKRHTKRDAGAMRTQHYRAPKKANPGNVIECSVGGGRMGSMLAHENEASFPEQLAEFFIRSFCPPGGTCMDIFGGSGTTAAVAKRLGRNCITIDIRDSQTDLTLRRLKEIDDERDGQAAAVGDGVRVGQGEC